MTENTPARTPFQSDIVWAGDLTAADSRETVFLVATAVHAEITGLIDKLRADHPTDLRDTVGFNLMIALERAVHELTIAARLAAPPVQAVEPAAPAEPTAPSGPVEYHLFAVHNGHRTFVHNFVEDADAAEQAAVNGNAQPGNLAEWVVLPVQV